MFKHINILKARTQWRPLLTFVPAAGVTLLPKCPLCLIGIMSAFGLSGLVSMMWLKPLTVAVLGVTVASLAIGVHRDRGYKPLLLGVFASVVVFVSKFYLDFAPATYGGLVLLFAATFWTIWVKRRATPDRGQCRFYNCNREVES